MTIKNKKGASPLRLSNKELRRELCRADVIIMTAVSQMSAQDQQTLELTLINCHTTDRADPLAETVRLQAMHRITPRRDWLKLVLAAFIVLLGVGLVASNDENQRLSDHLTQIQGNNDDYR